MSEKNMGCIFCEKLRETSRDAENFVLYRGEYAFILLNIYPYNNGHLMIAPYAHVPGLFALTDAQLLNLFSLTRRCEEALQRAVHPEGYNIGLNLGKAAGAGIEDHLHVHIVPRWNGDTNYMTTTSDARVIPQCLAETYHLLRPYFQEGMSSNP